MLQRMRRDRRQWRVNVTLVLGLIALKAAIVVFVLVVWSAW